MVVVWNDGNKWRKSVGLPAKQFHVTLSEADDHGVDKGILSLIGRDEDRDSTLLPPVQFMDM